MTEEALILLFFFLLLLQIFHVFEEIAMKAYEVLPSGNLTKYLFVASGILTVYLTAFLGVSLGLMFGYIMAVIVAGIAVANGIVHTVGFLKERNLKNLSGTLGAGFYSSIPLALYGVVVLVLFSRYLAGL